MVRSSATSEWKVCECGYTGECGHEPHGLDGLCRRCDRISQYAHDYDIDWDQAKARLECPNPDGCPFGLPPDHTQFDHPKFDSIDETYQTLNEPWLDEWHVIENDLVGGYSIATKPGKLSEMGYAGCGQMIADFTNSNYAHEIVRLHNHEGRDVATDEETGVPHGVGYWHLRARLAERKVKAMQALQSTVEYIDAS